MTLRIATWNVWWRFGDWEARQPAIRATLAAAAPDVITLQETWPDQAQSIADELDMQITWSGRRFDKAEHPMGNAIISRWPIAATESRFLPDGKGREYRTIVFAGVDSPHGLLPIFTTHLEHRFDQSETRTAQLKLASEFIAEHDRGDFPPVLTGDLNAIPDSDEIRRLTGRTAPYVDGRVWTDCWEFCGEGDGLTWSLENEHLQNTTWPNRRLDYVLVGWPRENRPRGNPVAIERFGIQPVDGITPSDHYGLYVDFDTAPPPPSP